MTVSCKLFDTENGRSRLIVLHKKDNCRLNHPHDAMRWSKRTYRKPSEKVKFQPKSSFNSKICCKTLF